MRQLFVCAALALVACGGSNGGTNPGTGPLAIGIVSGDHQVVTAGHDSLPQPVVGKLVRKPDGSVAWIKQVPGRALDVLVPRAFAQGTVVTGSPVAGAVVCAVSTDPKHTLTPFVPCTNTAADGTARFFFTPDTTAGVASAEIRGTLNSEPAVFDTATATVLPDTTSEQATLDATVLGSAGYAHDQGTNTTYPLWIRHSGDAPLDLSAIVKSAVDKYGNHIAGPFTIGWTLLQLSTETLTTSTTTSGTLVSGTPHFGTFGTTAAHTGTSVTGFQPGYTDLQIFVSGSDQMHAIIAVLP